MKGTSRVVVSGACYRITVEINGGGDKWYHLLWKIIGPFDIEGRTLTGDTLNCGTCETLTEYM